MSVILRKKLNILLQGYEKRGKIDEAESCRRMLESIGHQ
jgi:pentatricopeptide repeat protein